MSYYSSMSVLFIKIILPMIVAYILLFLVIHSIASFESKRRAKKYTRWAPAVYRYGATNTSVAFTYVTKALYKTEESARAGTEHHEIFIKWLINTPYEIELEK